MVDILRNLHEWVPDANENGEEIFDRVPVMGDQKKTMEGGMGANSQSAMHTQNRDARKGYSSSQQIGILRTNV